MRVPRLHVWMFLVTSVVRDSPCQLLAFNWRGSPFIKYQRNLMINEVQPSLIKKPIEEKEEFLTVRQTPPTVRDIAPFGMIVQCKDRYYIQLSDNSSTPNWNPIGNLLEIAFKDFILDKNFIKQCLIIYKNNETLDTIGSILKNKNNL